MALALPGARYLFRYTQEALRHVNGKRVTLTLGVHAALSDFRWIVEDIVNRPTHIYELVPLYQPLMDITTHPARYVRESYYWDPLLCLGKCRHILALTSLPRPSISLAHCMAFPFLPDVLADLVSWSNTAGGTTHLDLEMDSSVQQHNGVTNCFYVQQRTVLSRTENMVTMWWQRKGSATPNSASAHFLQTQSLH